MVRSRCGYVDMGNGTTDQLHSIYLDQSFRLDDGALSTHPTFPKFIFPSPRNYDVDMAIRDVLALYDQAVQQAHYQ
ncbi:hypothetical protein NECAME_18376, partial [Necator americanus]